jgi:hypothetical protein
LLLFTDFPHAASLIALMMEAVQTSVTLVNSYQSAWCYNPEDSHLHTFKMLGSEKRELGKKIEDREEDR